MRFAVFWPAFLLAASALAQQPGRLQLSDLVAEALRTNPEILAAQKKYEAARQRPAQERALPDPMISAGWNANGNPLPGSGLGTEPTSNIGAMVSQQFPAPGKLRLKAQAASKEADAEAQQYRAAQLSVISRLKQAFYRLQHQYALTDLLDRNATALRSLLRVTEARYSVGRAAQADIFRAQTQITLIEARLVQADRNRRAREAEINALLSRPPGAPLPRPGDPHAAPLHVTADELMVQTRDAAPMLARDQKMIERADIALRLARKDFQPDVTLNAGYYNMGAMPAMYMFRADLNIPIRWGKLRAGVAEKSQQLAGTRHAYEATARALESRVAEEFLAAQAAQKLMELYSKTVMPQARLTIESSLASYQTGAIDFTAVLGNQIAVFEYEMNYHEQMEEFHLALARLEEITGVELLK